MTGDSGHTLDLASTGRQSPHIDEQSVLQWAVLFLS